MAAEAEPPFANIAIAGYGLVGASLGMAIRQRWPKAIVIAIDRKDVIETAMRLHAADVGGDDVGLAAGAELIVLAAPVLANIDLLSRLADVVPGSAMVTDVGGTKRQTVAAARHLPDRLAFIGGHPLAGAAAGGIDAARPDLFEGRPWILTPDESDPPPALIDFLTQLGARIQLMTPATHDDLLAYISHLPQLTASALMAIVGAGAGRPGLDLAGRGLRDTTRLASSPPGIWRDIAATNRDHIGKALDELIALLARLRADLERDGGEIDPLFRSAAGWKQILEDAFEKP
jgi:prephenate dehydrogenase